MDFFEGIEQTTTEKLGEKIRLHRKRFIHLFKARYLEMLPSLIQYLNFKEVSIDFLKVEVALRSGHQVVVGRTTKGIIQVLGYVKTNQSGSNPANLFYMTRLTHEDIDFIIPKHLRLPTYLEISHTDGCKTGDFVVLRNKTISYINDHEILDYYVAELEEIVVSRYSLTMQVKINTMFMGEHGDTSLENLINDIYTGLPYSKHSKNFDPVDQIYQFNNDNLAQNFQELKREYQHTVSELNNMLGMNALAVEKASGVSNEEVKGNTAYTTSNANIYLDGRNHGLDQLNKRYGLHLQALYNDEVLSEFSLLEKTMDLAEIGESNE